MGPDRRGVPAFAARPAGRWFPVAGATVLALSAIGVVSAVRAVVVPTPVPSSLTALTAAASAAAVVVGVVAIVRWRILGDAAALWLALGLLCHGSVGLALAGFASWDSPSALPHAVNAASHVVALACFGGAVTSPDVITGLRLRRALAGVALAVLVGAALLVAAPAAWQALGGVSTDLVVDSGETSWLGAVGRAAVAAAALVRWRRQGRSFMAWTALGLAAAAAAQGVLVATGGTVDVWVPVLRLAAASCLLTGVVEGLADSFQHERDVAHVTALGEELARLRLELAELDRADRTHEATNALAAIEAAASALDTSLGELEPASRDGVLAALRAELARVKRLVDADAGDPLPYRYDVGAVLERQVLLARAQGDDVRYEVAGESLDVIGDAGELAQVVQNLLTNARRHAPGSPVLVRAAADGGSVVVDVADRGPGIPADLRASLLQRGARGPEAAQRPGSGLGLAVACGLLAARGGALGIASHPGGGTVVTAQLPRHGGATAASEAERGHERQQALEPVDEGGGDPVVAYEPRAPGAIGRQLQPQRPGAVRPAVACVHHQQTALALVAGGRYATTAQGVRQRVGEQPWGDGDEHARR